MQDQLKATKQAAYRLALIQESIKKEVLKDLAKALLLNAGDIMHANQRDLNALSKADPRYDRLLLNQARLTDISQTLDNIAAFDSPIGKILEEYTLPNGLHFQRKTVPLGVVGMIYEARPNVTVEAFALCFMSSNACVLKGGSDARHSNILLVQLIQASLKRFGVPTEVVLLLSHEREAVKTLLEAKKWVDVLIPRGSQALIEYVRENARIPVIETGAGVVHTYFDVSGDLEKGQRILHNAKTRRVSVCNALDCLLIHEKRLVDLTELVAKLASEHVKIHADEKAYPYLEQYPSTLLCKAAPCDFGTEFLSYDLAIKTVRNIDEALLHIQTFSSCHSEAIIAEDKKTVAQFLEEVDAAVVYANVSTAFTDGGEFGMGSEIGISTQKLHVRGPFSMQHLVSTKWLVQGDGQVRS